MVKQLNDIDIDAISTAQDLVKVLQDNHHTLSSEEKITACIEIAKLLDLQELSGKLEDYRKETANGETME